MQSAPVLCREAERRATKAPGGYCFWTYPWSARLIAPFPRLALSRFGPSALTAKPWRKLPLFVYATQTKFIAALTQLPCIKILFPEEWRRPFPFADSISILRRLSRCVRA
ncbi:hypothetical protein MPLDJ20_260169 [Mesorhizobium plurifarium]|uniref:Uncharacterized protein n=1 Tax=Mesorhizobium plurifarium TaxID=69974 RepID=A0A090F7X8_MESPL|nr:hypothetical protein MPLDJ20_260169 [Mesorhizobium plurifarium]